jgi:septal ring factor EnvC (AmiA/AmiB activator)
MCPVPRAITYNPFVPSPLPPTRRALRRTGRAFVIVATMGVIGLVTPLLPAQDAQRRVSERLRALQAEAEQLLAAEKTLLVELRRLEVERSIRLEEQRDAEAELATITAELDRTSAHLEALEQAHAGQVPELSARLAEIYKLGSGGYLRLLLNVDDVREMGRAYRTVAALASLDRERVRAHQSTLTSLREAHRDVETRQKAAAALEADARGAAAAAARAFEARTALVARIDAERDLNARLAGELDQARARLAETVSSLSPGAAASLPFRPFRGALDWPVAGRPVTQFGVAASSRYGTAVARNGIDIAAPEGADVRAVHEGTVAFAGPFSGFGTLAIVDHGDRAFTLYGYLASLAVTKGARVEKGGVVGTVGRSPAGGGSALYFEVRVDGKPTDPLQWLKPRLTRSP